MTGLSLLTPWYPTPYNRMAGSFVADHARICAAFPTVRADGGVHVVHALEWPGGTPEAAQRLRPSFDAVLDRLRTDGGTHLHGAYGRVDRVPVFTVGGAEWAERAEAAVRDTQRLLGAVDAPIAHGHVGYLGGVLAARLASAQTRVFATEHSSALDAVLAQPRAAELYREVLERVETMFCVSAAVRAPIVAAFPDLADKTEVLHNPIDFSGAPRRAVRPETLDRWVFVGGLREIKGVSRMVEAFIAASSVRPELSLTIYGSGPMQDQVEQRLSDAGLRGRAQLKGAVPHADLLQELPQYDLLVAPSLKETFHIAVPEAVAAGLPVIVTRSGGPQEALAGVEDQVGAFIDVADSPDEIVDAWQSLRNDLDRLDLDAARATLNDRYGWSAIAGRLAAAYGLAEAPLDAGAAPGGQLQSAGQLPERIVVPAVSGWRAYHVDAELDAVRALGSPSVVITDAEQIRSAAAPLTVLPISVVPAGGATAATHAAAARPVAATTAESTAGLAQRGTELARRGRRVAGLLKRRVSGGSVPAQPSSAPPSGQVGGVESGITWPPFDLDGATLVLTDCQSMPLAQRLLDATPGLRAVVELDRIGPLAPPADGASDE